MDDEVVHQEEDSRLLPQRCECLAGSSVSSPGSHAKRRNPTHSTRFTDRRGYALLPSSLA